MRTYFIECTVFIMSHLNVLLRVAGQGGACLGSCWANMRNWNQIPTTHIKKKKPWSLDTHLSVTIALWLEAVRPDSESDPDIWCCPLSSAHLYPLLPEQSQHIHTHTCAHTHAHAHTLPPKYRETLYLSFFLSQVQYYLGNKKLITMRKNVDIFHLHLCISSFSSLVIQISQDVVHEVELSA